MEPACYGNRTFRSFLIFFVASHKETKFDFKSSKYPKAARMRSFSGQTIEKFCDRNQIVLGDRLGSLIMPV